jgi:hypothetical protein
MQRSRVPRRALQDTFDAGHSSAAVNHSTPSVSKPSRQTMQIHQNGRLIAATIAARRRLVAAVSPANGRGDASWHESL